jgi:multiple antibiotic resistance protein
MPFFFKALVALFTMVDPIGLVPVVLGITHGLPSGLRALVVTRATLIAGSIIVVFGAFGQAIFSALGVTGEAFSIAGGALLFLVAIDMLFGRPSGARETPREAEEARMKDALSASVFPLAIPMIAGPGTITTTILLVQNASARPSALLAIAIAAAITLIAAWLAMMISLPIQKGIGTTGILVLSRVLGLLLAAVAAQFILNGIAQFVAHVG